MNNMWLLLAVTGLGWRATAQTPTIDDWDELNEDLDGYVSCGLDLPPYWGNGHLLDALTPAGVVVAWSEADVVKAVQFAQRFPDAPIRAQAGGNSFSNYNTCDGCIVVDVSDLNGIEYTETADGTVYVAVQPGVILMDLVPAMRNGQYPQHVLPHGSCPRVAIGGWTQGGGWGALSRLYGLGADHVVGVRIVLADGSVRTVLENATLHDELGEPAFNDSGTACKNDDLLWAIRGGGAGNWGIITEFLFEPSYMESPEGTRFVIDFEYDAAAVKEVFRAYRDFNDPTSETGQLLFVDNSFYVTPDISFNAVPFAINGGYRFEWSGWIFANESVAAYIVYDIILNDTRVRAATQRGGSPKVTHYANYMDGYISDQFPGGPDYTLPELTVPGYPTSRFNRNNSDVFPDAFIDAYFDFLDDQSEYLHDVTDPSSRGFITSIFYPGGAITTRDTNHKRTAAQNREWLGEVQFTGLYLGAAFANLVGDESTAQATMDDTWEMVQYMDHVLTHTFGDDVFMNYAHPFELNLTRYYPDAASFERLRGIRRDCDPGQLFDFPLAIPPADAVGATTRTPAQTLTTCTAPNGPDILPEIVILEPIVRNAAVVYFLLLLALHVVFGLVGSLNLESRCSRHWALLKRPGLWVLFLVKAALDAVTFALVATWVVYWLKEALGRKLQTIDFRLTFLGSVAAMLVYRVAAALRVWHVAEKSKVYDALRALLGVYGDWWRQEPDEMELSATHRDVYLYQAAFESFPLAVLCLIVVLKLGGPERDVDSTWLLVAGMCLVLSVVIGVPWRRTMACACCTCGCANKVYAAWRGADIFVRVGTHVGIFFVYGGWGWLALSAGEVAAILAFVLCTTGYPWWMFQYMLVAVPAAARRRSPHWQDALLIVRVAENAVLLNVLTLAAVVEEFPADHLEYRLRYELVVDTWYGFAFLLTLWGAAAFIPIAYYCCVRRADAEEEAADSMAKV